jgi:hypothetical protein
MQHTIVFDFELKQRVTRWQIYVVSLTWIPTGDDQPSRIRIALDGLNKVCDLVYAVAFRIVTTERAPEIAVYRSQISDIAPEPLSVCFISPLCPDINAFLAEVLLVRVAGQEPEQLFCHPAKGYSLRCDYGKACAQIESGLITEV